MKKFKIKQEGAFIRYIRYGYREIVIEAPTAEEALEEAKSGDWDDEFEFVQDDYEIEDKGFDGPIEIEELETEVNADEENENA